MPRKETAQKDSNEQNFVFDLEKIFLNGGIDQTPFGISFNKLMRQFNFSRYARMINPTLDPEKRFSEDQLSSIGNEIMQLGEELGVPTDDESLTALSDQYWSVVSQRMPKISKSWVVRAGKID